MYLHQVLSAEDTAAEIRERIGYYQQVPPVPCNVFCSHGNGGNV